MMDESREFMKRQLEGNFKTFVKSHWDSLEELLKERNLLPSDYSEEKYHLQLNDGVIMLIDRNDGSQSQLLRMLLGGILKD